jgi:hypothetical protein
MPTFQEIPPTPTFKELPPAPPAGEATQVLPFPTKIDDYHPSTIYKNGDIVRGPDGNFYSCVDSALAGDGLSGGGWGPICIDSSPRGDSVRNPNEDLDDDAMQLARAFASRSSDSGGTLHSRVIDLLDDAYKTIEPLGGWGHI